MKKSHNPTILNVANDNPQKLDGTRFYVVELINGDYEEMGPFESDGERNMHRSISQEIERENQRKLRRA